MQEHSTIPLGLCQCGCGRKTRIVTSAHRQLGYSIGEPVRFIRGHNNAPTLHRTPPLPEWFWSWVNKTDSCWLWIRGATSKGYGEVYHKGHQYYAHRLAYEITYGSIPPGLDVCHHCDNPRCVRPDHLFLGTAADNAVDMVRKGRNISSPPKGQKNPISKLADDQVTAIRRRYTAGGCTHLSLSIEYGVSRQAITAILTHRNWKHLP